MVSIQNINNTQSPIIVSKLPKGAKNLSFNAESDQYVRQNKQPVYTQPPILDQQAAMRRAIEEQQKAQKNQKLKQNLSWGISIASGIAIIVMVLLSFKSMKGDPADLELIKKIKNKLPDVKDPAIRQQIKAELRLNSQERNLNRAENLITLDELARDTASRTKVPTAELRKKLDDNTIGVEKAKDALVRGVKKANFKIDHGTTDVRPLVIILDGSPGTSKTTLAKQYADAAGLYYKKVPMGGVSDAQTIIGFKRTYMGSQHGVIAEAQIESGTKNVCYCFDEIDRVTKKEVLDALLSPFEGNPIFIDQYYGVPIDLSRSTFIMTTNDFTKLPEALKNRASIIHIADYTPGEKSAIAKLKLNLRIKNEKVEQYIESIDESIYDEIVSKTSDAGGRQVDTLTEEITGAIECMQQDGLVSTEQKVKIDKQFLEKIKLGENMQEAARLQAERASSVEWQMNNL